MYMNSVCREHSSILSSSVDRHLLSAQRARLLSNTLPMTNGDQRAQSPYLAQSTTMSPILNWRGSKMRDNTPPVGEYTPIVHRAGERSFEAVIPDQHKNYTGVMMPPQHSATIRPSMLCSRGAHNPYNLCSPQSTTSAHTHSPTSIAQLRRTDVHAHTHRDG
jgi:hypothetical protein